MGNGSFGISGIAGVAGSSWGCQLESVVDFVKENMKAIFHGMPFSLKLISVKVRREELAVSIEGRHCMERHGHMTVSLVKPAIVFYIDMAILPRLILPGKHISGAHVTDAGCISDLCVDAAGLNNTLKQFAVNTAFEGNHHNFSILTIDADAFPHHVDFDIKDWFSGHCRVSCYRNNLIRTMGK